MKRIKAEEIQTSIQNHLKHRNILKPLNQMIDMNLMALNDLSLIESTINDYYSFSLNSSWNSNELFNQFDKLKAHLVNENVKIQKMNRDLIIFGLFIYISIDLVLINCDNYKNFINKNIEELRKVLTLDQEQDILLESLTTFVETKDLHKSEQINKWYENKFRLKISEIEWNELLKHLNTSKSYLLLNQLNTNFQIQFDFDELETDECDNLKLEDIKFEKFENDVLTTQVNPKKLSECFQKIRSQTSRLNSACYFYTNDISNEITSSTLSSNIDLLSYTTENSTIELYKLNEGLKFKNNKFYKHKLTLLNGNSGAIFKSKFTHDSKFLISCGEDGYSYLWNVRDESKQYPVCAYSGHTYPVWDVETFSRLNLFATCSKDGKACLWSFDRLYPLRVYCGHQSDVNCVKFHPNGLYLATGSNDKTVRLWSVQTSEFVRLFSGHRSRVFSLAFSPDGNYLASAGEDRKIKVWDLRTGGMLKELKGHSDIVHSICFDNNSEIICSGGLDKTIKFWDVHQKGIGKSLQSPTSSNEMIKSLNVNFNVYSIETDVQNVFYITGAMKPKVEKIVVSPVQEKVEPKVKEEKKVVPKIEPKPVNNNQTPGFMNTRRRTAISQGTSQQTRVSSNFNFLNNDDLYEV